MERVAFLVEGTGERIGCMLNPESVVLRRRAGVRPRRSAGGLVVGTEVNDDPVLLTGGGRTELDLDLLFDVSLAGSSAATEEDVRRLTSPLWDLAESTSLGAARAVQPQVRFFWAKWGMPGVVLAVAERLEYFTAGGVPRRSWLRLRMLRVAEPTPGSAAAKGPSSLGVRETTRATGGSGEGTLVYEITGGGAAGQDGGDASLTNERLDQLADRYYGDPSLWRLIAQFNNLDDPMRIASGVLLEIPAGTAAGGA